MTDTLTRQFADTVRARAGRDPEFRAAVAAEAEISTSLEIREVAAALYEQAWLCEERMVKAEDEGVDQGRLGRLEQSCLEAWKDYEDFVGAEGFDLLTESSGSVLRCAKTQIPLVDTDEVIEGEGDQLIRVVKANAA